MKSVTVSYVTDLQPIECYFCGVIFGMTIELYKSRLRDHKSFYCPNGHGQVFIGKTEVQKLKEQLQETEARLANTQLELLVKQKETKRLQKRVKNGACPCCHRQFVQLARHMKTKHPEYAQEQT